jgi:hypothetical protein
MGWKACAGSAIGLDGKWPELFLTGIYAPHVSQWLI